MPEKRAKKGNGKLALFATLLRMGMKSRSVQGKELADLEGVSEVTVSRWLTGKMIPPAARRRRIEKSLRLPQGYLDQTAIPEAMEQEDLEEIRNDADYEREGPGFQWDRTDYTQLGEDEVLELLMQDPRGFLRYLMTTYEQRAPVSTAAKLGYLDFIESIAKEKGVSIPAESIETYRRLVRQRSL